MANTPQSADNDDLQFQRDIDEVFSRANPNPDRIGCPPRDTLVRLARRQQPIGDPAYEHLAKCSPCYREFRELQETAPVSTTVSRGTSRAWMAAAAVAALVVVAFGTWWLTRGESNSGTPQLASAPATTSQRAELDLRKFAVLRSEQGAERQEPVVVPTGVVELTLLLPVGSEPGPYDIQVLDADLKSLSTAHSVAEIQNFITTLRATLDLRTVPPGAYQLAVRRQGDDWRMFPARIK